MPEGGKMKRNLSLTERAGIKREAGNFKEALILYKKAVKKYSSFESLSGLGGCLRLTGDFRGAIKAYKKALKENICSEPQKADCFMGLGMSHRALSDYSGAAKHFFAAGKIYKESADWAGYAYFSWCLGGLRRITGDLKGSHANFLLSLKFYKLLKDESGTAYALAGLGGILRMLGNFKESFVSYKRASVIFKKQGDRFGFAYCNCGMGSASRMLFRAAVSEKYYKIALKTYRRIEDEVNISFVLWGYANTLMLSGRLLEAAHLLNKSKTLFLRHKDKRGLVYSKLQEGEFLRLSGKIAAAVNSFKSARIMAETLGLKFEAMHALTGLFACGKAKSPYKQYDKLGSKWYRVLKRNTPVFLDFP